MTGDQTARHLEPENNLSNRPDLLDSALSIGPDLGGIRGLETITAEPKNEVNQKRFFSTKEKPIFSVISPPVFSTKESPETLSQVEIIRSDNSLWKCRKNRPPYPPNHCLNPAGRREKGRQVFTGFQILRRAKCRECHKEVRKVAGYLSATQLIELEREANSVKIGIVRNLLRKSAGRIDRDLIGLRCAACNLRRPGRRLEAV